MSEMDEMIEAAGGFNCNKTPFPWFGGKSQAAPLVWSLLGDVPHYVEPFLGGGAVLLGRPHPCNRTYYSETINDLDGQIVNVWRSIQHYPEEVARHASWPVTELDKNARQIAVLQWRKTKEWEKLAGTADYCDPQMAGWWLYGTCCQIGAFDGAGAWTVDPETGRIVKQGREGREPGVSRDLPHLSGGRGVNHAGLREPGVSRDRPHLGDNGMGVNHPQLREPGVSRDLPHLSGGRGVNHAAMREPGVTRLDALASGQLDLGADFHDVTMPKLIVWMRYLAARLRHVRIVNGDWARVCTTGAAHTLPVRQGNGPCGVFLDPPYSDAAGRNETLYAEESLTVAHDVREWCVENGGNPKFRIVLAGYDTEHAELEQHGWSVHEWFVAGFLKGGMGNTSTVKKEKNQQHRERLWASPHCLKLNEDRQKALF